MKVLFNGDIIRPVVISVDADNLQEAIQILESAESRGNLADSRISIYDEDSDQRLAGFQWDGEDGQEQEPEWTSRLIRVK